MVVPFIKRALTVIFICACAISAKSQQIHFVYIQTENGQPFYVKFDNKIISSSTSGYLILSKLVDSNYNINIGFPKKEFPEESFQFSVNNRNEGFLLKNFYDKGWGLFNMRTLSLAMGVGKVNSPTAVKNLQDDSFSKMLANVVKDSSILEKNESEKEVVIAPKIDSPVAISAKGRADSAKENNVVATNIQPDSATNQTQTPTLAEPDVTNVPKPDSAVTTGNYVSKPESAITKPSAETVSKEPQPSLLKPAAKYFRRKINNGMEMVYIDPNESGNDTVRVFIPETEPAYRSKTDTNVVAQNEKVAEPFLKDTSGSQEENAVKPKENFQQTKDSSLSISSPRPTKNTNSINKDSITNKQTEGGNPGTDQHEGVKKKAGKANDVKKDEIVVLPKVVESSISNSDCKAFANNEDFLRLRKKMASENNDEQMIKIAKKSFHWKCFSTEQIKNLSFLFLTNEGKYRFFDVAYPFASDSDQYKTLQTQLTDSYYINRFNAMIHQ